MVLPEEVIDKVENEIPTTPALLEAKYSALPDLEATFEKFYKVSKSYAKLIAICLAALIIRLMEWTGSIWT